MAEWLRGHALTGFPWNTYGYAFSGDLLLMQSAAVVGIWGLTFFCILLLSTPVLLLGPWRRGIAALAAAALAIAGAALWGGYRLAATQQGTVPGVALRVMQPNLSQDKKFAYDRRQQILEDYLALSGEKSEAYPRGLADVTVLIWPESAFLHLRARALGRRDHRRCAAGQRDACDRRRAP